MMSPTPPLELPPLDPKKVFYLLGNKKRRRLLLALADRVGKAVSQMAPLAGPTQDAAFKHLTQMRLAGLVRMEPDPQDERRKLYTLDPRVALRQTERGLELDFDCCVMRVH